MANDTVFFCADCGHESGKWLGQCPGCGVWNRYVEQPRAPGKKGSKAVRMPARGGGPLSVAEAMHAIVERTRCDIGGFDRVLGGGLVPGSLLLLAGAPGVGKSTLLLQVSASLARDGKPAVYVSAEESAQQIARRADRVGGVRDGLLLLPETSVDAVLHHLEDLDPSVVVIDSVQTMEASEVDAMAGSPSQVRAVASKCQHLAKTRDIPVVLVGHVTKDGLIAGPKLLEHLVDVVLSLEGEPGHDLRALRATKNRFGTVSELALYSMTGTGMESVLNPSAWLLEDRRAGAPGSVVAVALEGTAPLLVEVQALVTPSHLGTPRRVAHGLDGARLALVLAVLERHAGVSFRERDVFVNLVGGLALREPGLDVAVAAALLSSATDRAFAPDVAMFGEVGLMGEIRAVSRTAERVREAAALGFATAVVPARRAEDQHALPVRGVGQISDLLDLLS